MTVPGVIRARKSERLRGKNYGYCEGNTR